LIYQNLQEFNHLTPLREVDIGGVRWRYRALGEGSGVLILPGAIGDGELSFHLMMQLAQHHRVIAPSYPSVPTMRGLSNALAGLLDYEGIEVADLIGGSYGGLVAQVMARTHPSRVRSMVLSHTGVPRLARARTNERVIHLLRVLPMPVVRWLLRRIVGLVVKHTGDARELWLALSLKAVNAITREDVISTYQRSVDLDRHYAFRSGEVSVPVLVIASTNDRVARAQVPLLRALYPDATVKLFEGTGHATAMAVPAEFGAVVADFLSGLNPRV
jgi:pimeloyl-ACP methyl ester carboxylesterase